MRAGTHPPLPLRLEIDDRGGLMPIYILPLGGKALDWQVALGGETVSDQVPTSHEALKGSRASHFCLCTPSNV
jgi:hypothetical protein